MLVLLRDTSMAPGFAERVFAGNIAREVTTGLAAAGFFWFVSRKRISDAPKSVVPGTNAQLVDDIATRADRWGTRQGLPALGSRPGTLKHGYADRVLTRYQRMFGDRDLSTEVRYFNGRPWQPGDPARGSIRLDVVEGPVANPSAVFDSKFGNATLTPTRVNQIRQGAGLGGNVPVIEVRP